MFAFQYSLLLVLLQLLYSVALIDSVLFFNIYILKQKKSNFQCDSIFIMVFFHGGKVFGC